jgi:hypothetical protein
MDASGQPIGCLNFTRLLDYVLRFNQGAGLSA